VHTSEPSVSRPSHFKVEIAIAKFKRYKSPNIDQILTEFIQARNETIHSEISKLIHSGLNKRELP
jgi:hypothetical protein